MAPRTDKLHASTVGLAVVLGVDVEEADFGHAGAGRILGEGADVENSVAAAVVGLVSEAIDDEPRDRVSKWLLMR